jgi:hypothetical protein
MNVTLSNLAAVPMIPTQGSAFGNVGSATIAVIFLGGGWYMAKHEFLLYGPWMKNKLRKKDRGEGKIKWDWLSIISFVIGFWGVTSLLGASGLSGVLIDWAQGIILWFKRTAVGAAIGAAGICAILTFVAIRQAVKREDDAIHDIAWGAGLAITYPLGGGPFLWVSTTMANALIELLNGIPVAS